MAAALIRTPSSWRAFEIQGRRRRTRRGEAKRARGFPTMVKVATYFAMSFGVFVFWQSMEKLHVWIALHQDEKKERLEREMEIKLLRDKLLTQLKED